MHKKRAFQIQKFLLPWIPPWRPLFRPRAGPGPDQQTGPPLERKSRVNRPDHVGERAGPGGKIIHTSRLWRRKAWTPCCSGERRRPTENALKAENGQPQMPDGKNKPPDRLQRPCGALRAGKRGSAARFRVEKIAVTTQSPSCQAAAEVGQGVEPDLRPRRRRRTQSLWPTGIRRGGRAWGSPRSGRGTRCPSTQARRVNGGGIVDHCGVAAQDKCPAKCSA